jgi:AraC family transcriptional regulator, regulatory protein of adaptative response / DNA-3-methyladenine glycosylase II
MGMQLDADICYKVLLARDRRFDGLFFVAVSTTGIYCRPICPARTPGRDRVTFFRHAAEAEQAGYRACFRCRPEVAPRNSEASTDAISHLVRLALSKIEQGCLNGQSLEELAADLGVSSRHLRRSIEAEVGVSPVMLAQTRRLALAKQLLHDTTLPMAEIADAAGFASIRRFNGLFQSRFGRSPTSLRRAHGASEKGGTYTLRLDYRPPFDWKHLLGFLGDRAMHGIERVEGDTYYRTIPFGKAAAEISVRDDAAHSRIIAEVPVQLASMAMDLSANLRKLFDLDARPDVIEKELGRDKFLGPIVKRQKGTRLPGAFDSFEVAIRSVLGQQVTVRGATTLAKRVVEKFGHKVEMSTNRGSRAGWIFPSADDIAAASVSDVREIGMPEARAKTLIAISKKIADGKLKLSAGENPEAAIESMTEIAGIGNFTSHVVAMRALRYVDAFPSSDLGVRKALNSKNARELDGRAEAWRPWRAYAVIHLWRNSHANGG